MLDDDSFVAIVITETVGTDGHTGSIANEDILLYQKGINDHVKVNGEVLVDGYIGYFGSRLKGNITHKSAHHLKLSGFRLLLLSAG